MKYISRSLFHQLITSSGFTYAVLVFNTFECNLFDETSTGLAASLLLSSSMVAGIGLCNGDGDIFERRKLKLIRYQFKLSVFIYAIQKSVDWNC